MKGRFYSIEIGFPAVYHNQIAEKPSKYKVISAMTGKKITARKAREVCSARKARRNARKIRKANQPYELIASAEAIPTNTIRKLSLEEILLDNRIRQAKNFIGSQISKGAYPCGDVNKTLLGRFCEPYSWTEADKSTGFKWVALYGLDFLAVVFKKNEDAARRSGYVNPKYIGTFYDGLTSTVVAEMEGIANGTICPLRKRHPGLPFAVVCETTSSTNVQEASNAAPDQTASVKFLWNEFRNGFSLERSGRYIKVAISALQLVHEQKFQADEIWVGLWDVMVGKGSLSHDSIIKYLADINHPDSGGCGKEEHSLDINEGFSEDHLVVNEPDGGGCSKEEDSHDINGSSSKDLIVAVNEPDSGGCSKEHSHDINEGFLEDHLAVNEPDSGGCSKE